MWGLPDPSSEKSHRTGLRNCRTPRAPELEKEVGTERLRLRRQSPPRVPLAPVGIIHAD